ncbi:MAG TPA: tetratricopeptide repeat protein [Polyangiaceae bacterium]|nr:tetratricopeptide repeat protein [Polyangiaceae bacterium]
MGSSLCRTLRAGVVSALVISGTPGAAFADDASVSAREHFARGYASAEGGDTHAAIREFERAYAASPNPAVLYNLGQAYAAAGRSSEAIDALERYLELDGSSASEAKTRRVKALIAYHSQRVGKLDIDVDPKTATLWVDGKSVGEGARTVVLDAGAHHLVALAPGFEAAHVPAEIPAQGTATMRLRLEPQAAPAQIAIACPWEGVAVSIDGALRGLTPALGSSVTTSGGHRIRFERDGYLPDEHNVDLAAGVSRSVSCRLAVDPNDRTHGRLTVRHPPGTTVFLDGAPFRDSLVPRGVHLVRVEGPGYIAETRRMTIAARERQELTLQPARDPVALDLEHQRTQSTLRTWSYVLAGITLATGATAAGLYVDNTSRYEAWQAESRRRIGTLPSDPNAPQSLDALLAEENSIRRRDSLALGLTVVSLTTLAASAVLYLTSRDSERRLVLTADSHLHYQHAF